MNESASSGNGQEFDVFSAMDWKDGIGTLPGSDLKVRYVIFLLSEIKMLNAKIMHFTSWCVGICFYE